MTDDAPTVSRAFLMEWLQSRSMNPDVVTGVTIDPTLTKVEVSGRTDDAMCEWLVSLGVDLSTVDHVDIDGEWIRIRHVDTDLPTLFRFA